MSAHFQDWMKSTQQQFEVLLASFLPDSDVVPAKLHQAMRYAALDGGKRVRPLLVYAAGFMFDAPADLLARAAAALEMIHAYSLVHDDMPCMDDDALRRGKPTVHVKYDEATALLVGDALQAQAFLVLAEAESESLRQVAMLRLLAQAAGSTGMCGGQAIDLASVGVALTVDQLEQMHRLKTGALLRGSVIMGAMCGKTLSAAEVAALDAYASAIGLAFQVVDDVLDATADSVTLGKTAGKDAADNKPTYVSLLGLEASQALAKKLCDDAHAALLPFGEKAHILRNLADLIVQRKA
ncbi:polyprenyl synthetase family protein [Undibacterium sp. RTI2.1]|uniref:polyprenyl synthetase family protein n=1 Tax=unclassified Undibacterium TaxID=2630295 RepID=UPI002AB3697A|nr:MULTISPECIES: farnesyl diphosphate synthase [unclassified Undibacterium]MDY7539114.1 polyprenyl synthetase family protein [Undibacterium sp. 5I1]MEB0030960.1 polyprenyl synthetase family protein [Undibacterium sp. RTI2.1]MEB0115807.1 polyprenyl synthetase family protein [Undibacterium sp. RTI2.2]MEB0229751.1 polyprenyl synthetase family protein [Undibacterium sp. 10I3]MEB0259280.1 polyprenyl synthetase family protein [Undibacterium sp. 5I1]